VAAGKGRGNHTGRRETGRAPRPKARKRTPRGILRLESNAYKHPVPTGVLTERDMPSPLPERPQSAGGAQEPGDEPEAREAMTPDDLAWQAEQWASAGLNLGEILAKLRWRGPMPPALRQAVEQAVRRGRALGAAEVKLARYQAAIQGSVTAQNHCLTELAEDNPSHEHTVQVIRIEADGTKGEETHPAKDAD